MPGVCIAAAGCCFALNPVPSLSLAMVSPISRCFVSTDSLRPAKPPPRRLTSGRGLGAAPLLASCARGASERVWQGDVTSPVSPFGDARPDLLRGQRAAGDGTRPDGHTDGPHEFGSGRPPSVPALGELWQAFWRSGPIRGRVSEGAHRPVSGADDLPSSLACPSAATSQPSLSPRLTVPTRLLHGLAQRHVLAPFHWLARRHGLPRRLAPDTIACPESTECPNNMARRDEVARPHAA